jgi:hypothetical protein
MRSALDGMDYGDMHDELDRACAAIRLRRRDGRALRMLLCEQRLLSEELRILNKKMECQYGVYYDNYDNELFEDDDLDYEDDDYDGDDEDDGGYFDDEEEENDDEVDDEVEVDYIAMKT